MLTLCSFSWLRKPRFRIPGHGGWPPICALQLKISGGCCLRGVSVNPTSNMLNGDHWSMTKPPLRLSPHALVFERSFRTASTRVRRQPASSAYEYIQQDTRVLYTHDRLPCIATLLYWISRLRVDMCGKHSHSPMTDKSRICLCAMLRYNFQETAL